MTEILIIVVSVVVYVALAYLTMRAVARLEYEPGMSSYQRDQAVGLATVLGVIWPLTWICACLVIGVEAYMNHVKQVMVPPGQRPNELRDIRKERK